MQHLTHLPSLASVSQQPYPTLKLNAPYDEVLGKDLPRFLQWSILIIGSPGSGKSSLLLKLANQLVRNTGKNLLYNINEEPLKQGSVIARARDLKINDVRIKLYDGNDIDTLRQHLATGKYAYCFIDSMTNFRNASDEEVLKLKDEFPSVSFIFISMVDSYNKAKVSKNIEHLVYAVYRTSVDKKTGQCILRMQKSRYGAPRKDFDIFAL